MTKIGFIADCQYGDLDDQHQEGRVQRFRQVPDKLKRALEALSDCDFVVHLGDIIQSHTSKEVTEDEFNLICSIFEEHAPHMERVHVLGNHCIQTLGRETVMERLRIPEPGYYTRDIAANWKFVVLDTTEMSGHSQFPDDSDQVLEANAYWEEHPLSPFDAHMVSWNGGITARQREWLENELECAQSSGTCVIIVAHHQVCPGAARMTHLAWNHGEILETITKYSAVKLFLAGHDHIGGGNALCLRAKARNLQYFVTVPAILEAPEGSNAHVAIDLDMFHEQGCTIQKPSSADDDGTMPIIPFGARCHHIMEHLGDLSTS
ncbi:Manganese-dependent ADP-ribose/CDP-alcohol diphosphatase [Picochlorum sp. SENEW3]|nr:Manganese-dependent ADP-ribose/CDP-alcohol diphosphatase [Picochlorum sp. SENEW3]